MKSNEWKTGISTCGGSLSVDESTFRGYAEAGIDVMEISLEASDYPRVDWDAVRRLSEKHGVGLWSVHLPYYPFETNNISSKNATVRKNTVALQREYIKRASVAGISVFVVHPSAEPNDDADRRDMLAYGAESLAMLAETAEACGAVIAAEDLPRTCIGNCSADILALISADSRLGVCFDTNHLLTETGADFVRAVNGRIVTLHVSDYDFRNERHWLPYEGKNDWRSIIKALEDTGYTGPFMYEVPIDAPPSIGRRRLTFGDFASNSAACLNGRKPEILGVPVVAECDKTAYYAKPHPNLRV